MRAGQGVFTTQYRTPPLGRIPYRAVTLVDAPDGTRRCMWMYMYIRVHRGASAARCGMGTPQDAMLQAYCHLPVFAHRKTAEWGR